MDGSGWTLVSQSLSTHATAKLIAIPRLVVGGGGVGGEGGHHSTRSLDEVDAAAVAGAVALEVGRLLWGLVGPSHLALNGELWLWLWSRGDSVGCWEGGQKS